jgi:hypothetical protein
MIESPLYTITKTIQIGNGNRKGTLDSAADFGKCFELFAKRRRRSAILAGMGSRGAAASVPRSSRPIPCLALRETRLLTYYVTNTSIQFKRFLNQLLHSSKRGREELPSARSSD